MKKNERDLQREIEAYKQMLERVFGTSDLRIVSKMLDAIDGETQNQLFYIA